MNKHLNMYITLLNEKANVELLFFAVVKTSARL